MAQPITGTRIRQKRKEMGVSQAALARKLEISASYLNLIEWNKRPIAGALLVRAAHTLNVGVQDLEGFGERRLQDDLHEIAQLETVAHLGVERDRVGELLGRFPGWSRALAALARSEQRATARAQMLSDRLTNDPFLGETVHRMLTQIASIRSASEILSAYDDIPAERRARFTEMINGESQTLSTVAEALAAYLDTADDQDRPLTPVDETERFFEANQNRFPEIEAAASDLGYLLSDYRPVSRLQRAEELAGTHLLKLIVEIVSSAPQIETGAARELAIRNLNQYAARCLLMPLASFTERAREARYDLEALAETFSTNIELVCQRLTALTPDDRVPRFGYFRANAAGTIIEMLGLDGLSVPRYAAACPLWALYRAQQSPDAIVRQRTIFPNGTRIVFLARARLAGPSGFGKPRHYLTDMLALTEEDAAHTVYAPDAATPLEEVGPSCRLCPRRNCAHRVEDPLSD